MRIEEVQALGSGVSFAERISYHSLSVCIISKGILPQKQQLPGRKTMLYEEKCELI